ncbi:MAG TPA: type III pantothenate kinase [Paludibacteraceae bacterium]|nr:type III pantothenate kinase [Paludibacteraceae bacterium]
MNLAIDRGNTATKIAVFDHRTLVYQTFIDVCDELQLAVFFEKYPITHVIYSSVVPTDQALLDFMVRKATFFVELTHTTKLPISLNYTTPTTLGRDRIAAMVGAWSLQPNKAAFVIDMGTCITYDFITAEGVFIGGNIAPGLAMRLKAMHLFTGNLPETELQIPSDYLGTSTQQAMLGGAYWGILNEIEGMVAKLKLNYHDFSTFLTGGTTKYFEKQIKNCTFAEPNLVLIGLNEILIYNDIH